MGLIPVAVERDAVGHFFSWLTTARIPESRTDVPSRTVLADMLGLAPGDILEDERDAPIAWSAGVPFLCVPVRDREVLARVSLDVSRWRPVLSEAWAKDVYIFCHETQESSVQVRARMFAPGFGIVEDPATGSAAAAFAGYLWQRHGGPGKWIIAQGVEMGRPSALHVEASGDGGNLQTVRVGGSAVRVSEGTLRLPD